MCRPTRYRKVHFAAVHDSFWTHPTDGDVLAEVLREQWSHIYGTYWPTQMVAYWKDNFPGIDLPDPPEPGRWHPDIIDFAPYFFA